MSARTLVTNANGAVTPQWHRAAESGGRSLLARVRGCPAIVCRSERCQRSGLSRPKPFPATPNAPDATAPEFVTIRSFRRASSAAGGHADCAVYVDHTRRCQRARWRSTPSRAFVRAVPGRREDACPRTMSSLARLGVRDGRAGQERRSRTASRWWDLPTSADRDQSRLDGFDDRRNRLSSVLAFSTATFVLSLTLVVANVDTFFDASASRAALTHHIASSTPGTGGWRSDRYADHANRGSRRSRGRLHVVDSHRRVGPAGHHHAVGDGQPSGAPDRRLHHDCTNGDAQSRAPWIRIDRQRDRPPSSPTHLHGVTERRARARPLCSHSYAAANSSGYPVRLTVVDSLDGPVRRCRPTSSFRK